MKWDDMPTNLSGEFAMVTHLLTRVAGRLVDDVNRIDNPFGNLAWIRMRISWSTQKLAIMMLIAAGLLNLSCASEPLQNASVTLDFLQAGNTSRDSIIKQLGNPSDTLESGRVFTYRLGYVGKQRYVIVRRSYKSWKDVKYSLVLVLDEQGILRRHSLVRVR